MMRRLLDARLGEGTFLTASSQPDHDSLSHGFWFFRVVAVLDSRLSQRRVRDWKRLMLDSC